MGEGGGQILRTAVTFAVIKGVPLKVTNIRAGRETPGLRRQHVSALRVLAEVFGGELQNAVEGSSMITFVPGKQRKNRMSIDMGTAASITLVLQAVVPAAALTGSSLVLDLSGGTDVPWSPTLDYIQFVVREAFKHMGIYFRIEAFRRGYYPKGGGKVRATIEAGQAVVPYDMIASPKISEARLISRCAILPRHVAERQMHSASALLMRAGLRPVEEGTVVEDALSPGTSFLAYSNGEGWHLGGDAIGARGKAAEEVGSDAATKFLGACRSGACLDANLADMVVPLLSLAPSHSRVRVQSVTSHLKSGLQVAKQFTGCSWSIAETQGSSIIDVVPKAAR